MRGKCPCGFPSGSGSERPAGTRADASRQRSDNRYRGRRLRAPAIPIPIPIATPTKATSHRAFSQAESATGLSGSGTLNVGTIATRRKKGVKKDAEFGLYSIYDSVLYLIRVREWSVDEYQWNAGRQDSEGRPTAIVTSVPQDLAGLSQDCRQKLVPTGIRSASGSGTAPARQPGPGLAALYPALPAPRTCGMRFPTAELAPGDHAAASRACSPFQG